MSILEEWNIEPDKIVSVVTDNGSNMIAAVQLNLINRHVPCFAHTINLVTTTAISCPTILGTVKKVRDIVKYIKNSVNVSDQLRKIQIDSEYTWRC